MLNDKNAVANLAVKDLKRARHFYADTLGLKQINSGDTEVLIFKSGSTTLNVYRSDYAGTNRATAVTWAVGDDLESVAAALKQKGVQFEHYDMPDLKQEGDIYSNGNMKVAWFKDPDGNILNLVNVDE
jgi:catechol 2,3-dioxygenase-like lactoylglutathione lyase family enzyme